MGILRGPRNPCKRSRAPRYTRLTPPRGSLQSSRTSGITGSETVIARWSFNLVIFFVTFRPNERILNFFIGELLNSLIEKFGKASEEIFERIFEKLESRLEIDNSL